MQNVQFQTVNIRINNDACLGPEVTYAGVEAAGLPEKQMYPEYQIPSASVVLEGTPLVTAALGVPSSHAG